MSQITRAVAWAAALLVSECAESVTPAEVELARFRAPLPRVDTLAHGQSSPQAVLQAVVRAAATHDTAALVRASVSRAEWAWLYYPTSRFVRPPYQMPPDVQWYLTLQSSEKGVKRLLRELGGWTVTVDSVSCDQSGGSESSSVWSSCRVSYHLGHAAATTRLVGTLLEHQGRFKVLSYANDF